ncbi:hypothetical protein H6P81_008735 [Aristolochia fimbriata]|uniref:ATP-dependent 6-phosphofructokinase n=1 Tax=Aristolochia fimbriata TaxID=158543 RepID=A0AAV7EIU6_ARIFI|nr:hypothetical protein H6P81_008735 [Aristolochia fimbriata]
MAGGVDESDTRRTLSDGISSVKLQKLSHLTDYLPDLSTFPNPLDENPFYHPSAGFFIWPTDVILRDILHDLSGTFQPSGPRLAYHRAGPRKKIFYNTSRVRAAIVTCGGLCPGLNTVIRELVVGLWELYGVREIFGIKSGYRGFYSFDPVRLDPKLVKHWHKVGGTALETSRGGFDLKKIVDAIESRGFNQVYIIGGDGTMRGAVKIFDEIRDRKLNIGVAGIPKTVDNDIGIIDRSFGFQTAVEAAQQAISAGHVEAESAVNGIGLVKLMGRSTGHIALHSTLSSRDVDCCLIPENDFYLEGEGGLLEFLDQRLKKNGHAVVVVAEGAGQEVIPRNEAQKEERDESGNPVFLDVGVWLKSELKNWWVRDHPGELFTVKYIDPTYMIRAIPANATDNLYCTLLAHSAIHGVMAGYTGFVSGPINGNYAYIPVEEVAVAQNKAGFLLSQGASAMPYLDLGMLNCSFPKNSSDPLRLPLRSPLLGGTALETARGGFDLEKIVDAIESRGFNQVYVIGGDGTMRGAVKIFNEIRDRKLNVAVAGIPKTVDNDIGIIDRSFGFQTAVEAAQEAINAGHVEAASAVNGIGLVKLMGRNAGHIALHATMSSRDVDCCLIPENDFYLEGEGGLFRFLEDRIKRNGHAVVVVAAEGAGQELIPRSEAEKGEKDESGNQVFLDVGVWLNSELKKWWARDHPGELFTVKYIDPTYMIRAIPANATDNEYCTLLAHSAIHGVMAGYTGFVSGPINGNYAYIPVEKVALAKNRVNVRDHTWAWLRSVNNQPDFLTRPGSV